WFDIPYILKVSSQYSELFNDLPGGIVSQSDFASTILVALPSLKRNTEIIAGSPAPEFHSGKDYVRRGHPVDEPERAVGLDEQVGVVVLKIVEQALGLVLHQ